MSGRYEKSLPLRRLCERKMSYQEQNLPATQKRAIPMITVPAKERVFQAKINVGMETNRAG
jgi:hypothetical protein